MHSHEHDVMLSDYLDGVLTDERLGFFEAHCLSCAKCQSEIGAFDPVVLSIRTNQPTVPYLSELASERIYENILAQVSPIARARPRFRWNSWMFMPAAGVAAIVLMVMRQGNERPLVPTTNNSRVEASVKVGDQKGAAPLFTSPISKIRSITGEDKVASVKEHLTVDLFPKRSKTASNMHRSTSLLAAMVRPAKLALNKGNSLDAEIQQPVASRTLAKLDNLTDSNSLDSSLPAIQNAASNDQKFYIAVSTVSDSKPELLEGRVQAKVKVSDSSQFSYACYKTTDSGGVESLKETTQETLGDAVVRRLTLSKLTSNQPQKLVNLMLEVKIDDQVAASTLKAKDK